MNDDTYLLLLPASSQSGCTFLCNMHTHKKKKNQTAHWAQVFSRNENTALWKRKNFIFQMEFEFSKLSHGNQTFHPVTIAVTSSQQQHRQQWLLTSSLCPSAPSAICRKAKYRQSVVLLAVASLDEASN